MTHGIAEKPEVYQGQFGEFTITKEDRNSVIIYRIALGVAALCFAISTGAVLWQGSHPAVLTALTFLYAGFSLALGVSLATIHIYLAPLHRLLQAFWVISCVASLFIALQNPAAFALTVYNSPVALIGVGFIFVALTGIFFKEAFCFNRLETKLLTPIVPLLLAGHWVGVLPVQGERLLLGIWAILFLVFAMRKAFQPIPPDIGDKTVFAYLQEQRATAKKLNFQD